jgi:hypothetical protein
MRADTHSKSADSLYRLMEPTYIETITNGVKLSIPVKDDFLLAQNSINTLPTYEIIVEIKVVTTISGTFNIYMQE